jgi:hypothetical protein
VHSSVEDVQFAGDPFSAQRAQIELVAAQLSMHHTHGKFSCFPLWAKKRREKPTLQQARWPQGMNAISFSRSMHTCKGGGDTEVRASASS